VSAVPAPIRWDGEHLELLDQTRLPQTLSYESMPDADAVHAAIRFLKVRGAPAIGIAAAYGVVVEMRRLATEPRAAFLDALDAVCAHLATARPTAVNLSWAVERVRSVAHAAPADATRDLHAVLRAEAERIHAEDRALCRAIGEHGLPLLHRGCGVLTHCNAGALAVSELGTATAPLYLAHARGLQLSVYVDETRPLLQGSRLTAWELGQAGMDVTLVCDSAAAALMAEGAIDLVLVGTDRVVANGDVVNKIGTLTLAVLCRHFAIPFYVACPSSTYDPRTPTGRSVVIEERSADEVRTFRGTVAAPAGVAVRNPAFDVTPHDLVTAIVTDRGVVRPPYATNLPLVLGGGARGSSRPSAG
jgi:methylthioribose-1-phosphate isomerase